MECQLWMRLSVLCLLTVAARTQPPHLAAAPWRPLHEDVSSQQYSLDLEAGRESWAKGAAGYRPTVKKHMIELSHFLARDTSDISINPNTDRESGPGRWRITTQEPRLAAVGHSHIKSAEPDHSGFVWVTSRPDDGELVTRTTVHVFEPNGKAVARTTYLDTWLDKEGCPSPPPPTTL